MDTTLKKYFATSYGLCFAVGNLAIHQQPCIRRALPRGGVCYLYSVFGFRNEIVHHVLTFYIFVWFVRLNKLVY